MSPPSAPSSEPRPLIVAMIEGRHEEWWDLLRFFSTVVWVPWVIVKRPGEWHLLAVMVTIPTMSLVMLAAAHWDVWPRHRRIFLSVLDVFLLTYIVWGLGSVTTPIVIFYLGVVLGSTMSATVRIGLVSVLAVIVGYGVVLWLESRGLIATAPLAHPGLGPHQTSGGRVFAFTTVTLASISAWVFLVYVRRRLEGGAARERALRLAEQAAQHKTLELQRQLELAQRMESLGRLAGGVAHDFNNLLTVIRGSITFGLGEAGASQEVREALEDGLGAARRAALLTQQLLAFSRRQAIRPQVLDPSELIVRTRRMLQRVIGEDVTVQLSLAAGVWPVNIDPTQLEQVLLNLAVNARDAMPKGGTLIIRCCNRQLSDAECEVRPGIAAGPFVQIEVVDNGCGMDEETLRRSLEPFFTTKPVGKGTGLGLATVFGIAQQNHGWFELASKPGEGTTATLLVPKSEGQAAPLSDGAPIDPRGKETVLLVEDEESLRRIARRALEQNGYTVLEAANGEEALAVARKGGEGIRALVADLVMPGMSGKALAEQMKKERPKLKVLYMSGYSPEAQDPQALLVDGAQFLAKPFEPDDLARSVRRLLDG